MKPIYLNDNAMQKFIVASMATDKKNRFTSMLTINLCIFPVNFHFSLDRSEMRSLKPKKNRCIFCVNFHWLLRTLQRIVAVNSINRQIPCI